MGSWGAGPFENDTAVAWTGFFERLPADRQGPLIRESLTAATVDRGRYLDCDYAFEAVAAAVAAARVADPDLCRLTVAALDRIVGDNSEWWSLRRENGPEAAAAALAMLRPIREAVQRASGGAGPGVAAAPPDAAGILHNEAGAGPLKYLTYTKYNRATGQVYTGRAVGRGTPEQILEAHDRRHGLTGQGFEAGQLDVWIEATRPYAERLSDRSYQAIRGREQGGIDANGGAARRA